MVFRVVVILRTILNMVFRVVVILRTILNMVFRVVGNIFSIELYTKIHTNILVVKCMAPPMI